MISIVLYGRNDNYGYNLHKRAALSFNCMAELLTDSDDEIIFVDYNTPSDFPTFPEAIQDTLTPLARKRLRVLRVRPQIHERFRNRTRLVALEPVSRNVAVRRSNPANRWILSTNTDMIFVPQTRQNSLSDIARDLPAGFYHAPRLEIPETLWEGLDRQQPGVAIETIKGWGSALHLNEIVLGAKTILYDGPGDFQLIERADLFKYQGFDEDMILGWHVDSNIAKRLYLAYGRVGDLGKEVYGYHCDHTRQITPMHSHTRTQNDSRRFIDDVVTPYLPEQQDTWGCANDEIEEIRISTDTISTYVASLRSVIGNPLEVAPVVAYTSESYDKVDYDPRHILPYLVDLFAAAPKNVVVAWYGLRRPALEMFATVWRSLGFTQPILINAAFPVGAIVPGTMPVDTLAMHERAGAFIFDCGSTSHSPSAVNGADEQKSIRGAFLATIRAERSRLVEGAEPRRIVCLNAIHTAFEELVRDYLGAGVTPFSTRMRHGFVLPPLKEKQDWSALLQTGSAGERQGAEVRAKPNETGVVCYGPYRSLYPGLYEIELQISGEAPRGRSTPIALLQLKWGNRTLGGTLIKGADLQAGQIAADLLITDELGLDGSLETVVQSLLPTSFSIRSVHCRPVEYRSLQAGKLASGIEWVELLHVGPGGRRDEDNYLRVTAVPDFVAYGPYWTLPAGRYEARVKASTAVRSDKPFLIVDVFTVTNGQYRAVALVNAAEARANEIRIEFEVHEGETPHGAFPVELRFRSMGIEGVIQSAIVQRTGEAQLSSPWVAFPDLPPRWQLDRSSDLLSTIWPLSAKIGGRSVRSILGAVKRRATRMIGS